MCYVNNKNIEYVEHQNNLRFLNKWNVVIISLKNETPDPIFVENLKIYPISRGIKRAIENEKLYIKRLTSPDDEKIDFDIISIETVTNM